jgi:glutathione S-transferase
MNDCFRPILYVKNGCPHCFKLRLFLLEVGLAGRFVLREFTVGEDMEQTIKAELSPHFDKVTFPTVQYAPGQYQNESDDLIARYAAEAEIDPRTLPLHVAWAEGLQLRLRRLNQENKELKAQLHIKA